jgi:hypothetical protein
MLGFIVERACEDVSEISVARNIGIHCRKWKTNILPTLIRTTACGTSILIYYLGLKGISNSFLKNLKL